MKSRFTESQIVAALKEVEAGVPIADVVRPGPLPASGARARLRILIRPGTVAQRTLGYDAAGQLSSDLITRGGSTSFPYPNGTTLRNFSVTSRNARGQILQATDQLTVAGGGYPKGTYDAFGNLTSDSLVQKGYTLANGTTPAFTQSGAFTYDGLGNMLTSSGGWSLPPSASSYATTNTYATTGRLSQQVNNSGSTPQTTGYAYDGGGNTRFEVTTPSGSPNVTGERATYYRGDDKVAAVDKRISGRRTLEEYRYDPLGRRVWVSTTTTCAPTNDVSCLTSAVRRTIWDGSGELAEIQAPIDFSAEELDSGVPTFPAPSSTMDPNPFFGRVVYAGGLAIDQPLSVTRYDYKDNPGTSLTWPRFTLFPMWDHRGTPVFGLFSDSAQYKPYAKGPTQTSCPNPGDNTTQRCVYVTWPFAGDPYDKAKGGLLTLSWLGSQLQTRRDGSGLEYLRHRLYDPKTGRFTQEDPIGLAGGLNAYGYASGDPVNFSDPFGLYADTLERTRETAPVIDSCVRLSETCRREVDLIERSSERWKVQFGDQSDCDADARGGCMRENQLGTGGTIVLVPRTYGRAAQLRGLPVNDYTVFGHEAGHVLTRRLMFCRTSEVCALQHEDAVRRELGMPRRRP